VDFKPDAVRLLVDRLKKNKKVGAACGRIHPIGSGIHFNVFACAYISLLFNQQIYLHFYVWSVQSKDQKYNGQMKK